MNRVLMRYIHVTKTMGLTERPWKTLPVDTKGLEILWSDAEDVLLTWPSGRDFAAGYAPTAAIAELLEW